jgi:hypothetical protein
MAAGMDDCAKAQAYDISRGLSRMRRIDPMKADQSFRADRKSLPPMPLEVARQAVACWRSFL